MKSAGDGTFIERGTLQLEVQELELKQQPASSLELRKEVPEAPPDPEQGIREAPPDPAEETWKAPSDRKEETREDPPNPEGETREVPLDTEEETWEVPWYPEKETREVPLDLKEGKETASSDSVEETREVPSDREDESQGTPSYSEQEIQEAPSDPEEEIMEAPSDPDEETKYAAGLAEGPTDLEGPVVPASRKPPIGGKLPPNNLKVHVESAGARRRGRRSTAKFPADERRRQRGECVDVRWRGHDVLSEESGATGPDSEGHATGEVNRQEMNALEMEEWRKVRRKKWKVARPNDKLVVRARMIYKTKMKDGEVEKYRCRLTV